MSDNDAEKAVETVNDEKNESPVENKPIPSRRPHAPNIFLLKTTKTLLLFFKSKSAPIFSVDAIFYGLSCILGLFHYAHV